MRTIAIGDIHGCLTALETLLAVVRPKPEDRLIFLGDLVDRGPDTCGVIDCVLSLSTEHEVKVVRGNHEEMLLAARTNLPMFEGWLRVGGLATLQSYGWELSQTDWTACIPLLHWEFLEHDLLDYVELERHFFVHANTDPTLPLAEQPGYLLRWEPFDDPPPHESGKRMICGHTSQRSGRPRALSHAVCIDTWVYGLGWLTALDVDHNHIWQANQAGEVRAGQLEELAQPLAADSADDREAVE